MRQRRSRASLAVRQRLASLETGLEASLDTDAEALHRARVASRRLREALPLVALPGGGAAISGFRGVVRDATRALGGVREIDVALSLVDGLAVDRPDLALSLDLVRQAMTAERIARLERMRRHLDPSSLQRASRELTERLDSLVDDRGPAEVLADRILERVEGLRRAIDDAGLLYAAERLHRVRLATKKLRYTLELAAEMQVASTRRLVNDLKRLQECLGQLHDLAVVAYAARQAIGPRPTGDPASLILPLLDDRIRAQHAEYLALRQRMAGVLDRAAVLGARTRNRRS